MKKIIYHIIKFPLILIFIKTPLIKILKKRFAFYRSYVGSSNIFWLTLDAIFQREYFDKLKEKKKIRELTDSTLINGEGKKWALYFYNNCFKTLEDLKKRKVGTINANEASPIFEKVINFIKLNNLTNDQNTYIIQIGSSSGRDLEFFSKIFPKLNYISTDVNDEILNFQKEKYTLFNLRYYKCYAENIDECIDNFNLSEKNIIIFSHGSLQYVNPFFLEEFFLKLKKYQKLNLFISEPVSLLFIEDNKIISKNRGNTSFSHRYDKYAKNSNINIIENKLIRPYLKDDKLHSQTGHFYLHISS